MRVGKFKGYEVYRDEGNYKRPYSDTIYLRFNKELLYYEMWMRGELAGYADRNLNVIEFEEPRVKAEVLVQERPIVEEEFKVVEEKDYNKEVRMGSFFDEIKQSIQDALDSVASWKG